MVELDCLAAFDCLQWLRTGERAGQALGCSQSTVSRATRKCEDAFGIRITKRHAEWQVVGDDTLLQAERRVHQNYRWNRRQALRIDSQHWLRPSYEPLDLPGWIKGNFNYQEYVRPLQLLQERVIDAWLCSAPDHPQQDGLTSIQLCRMPTLLMARTTHPLLQSDEPITLEAARRYPVSLLPWGAFPVFEQELVALGFHCDFSVLNDLADHQHHQANCLEDLALSISSPLALPLYDEAWAQLPLTLPIPMGDSLVVRTDFARHPRTEELVQRLCRQLRARVGTRNDVTLLHDILVDRLG